LPKSHVNTGLGRIMPTNSLDNTRRAYLLFTLPQVPITVQDILPVTSLPERSGPVILLVIPDVSPITDGKVEDIWI